MATICSGDRTLQTDNHELVMVERSAAVNAAEAPNEPANKLNYLIDPVGELVIASASATRT